MSKCVSMDRDEWTRAAYRKIVDALDQALSSLDPLPAGDAAPRDRRWTGVFHLGVAGGLAFSARLPGIESEALFDDISDAAEKRDRDQVGRIRESVAARLEPDCPPYEPPPGKRGLDWQAGPLQMLAALNEARTAREERNTIRFSLMMGFLVGLIPERFPRYQLGTLRDAVLAAHEPETGAPRAWVEAESIAAGEREGEAAETDPRDLLLRWVGARLSAGHRLSGPMFLRPEQESAEDRRKREAWEREYFETEEASVVRAQNFGKRIADPDSERLWLPVSYTLNRGLVLRSQGKARLTDGGSGT